MSGEETSSFTTNPRGLQFDEEYQWGGDDGEPWTDAIAESNGVTVSDTGGVTSDSRFTDYFEGTSLDTSKWTAYGTDHGNITVSDGTLTIEQTEGPESNENIIGVYATERFSVGSVLTVRSRNSAGRHAGIIGVADAEGRAFSHGTAEYGGPGANLYGRADDVTGSCSARDENGDTYSPDPSVQDFREFRELRIERPDENTVEFYIDGSLDTTISMPFAGDYRESRRMPDPLGSG